MTDFHLTKPVAFLIYNRPDKTARVFEEIRRARPPKLFVVADGPRSGKPGDTENCQAAQSILDRVDWPCEILTNYSDVNLGCKLRISSGLDWLFSLVEEAIILEDDCLPHPTFFRLCEDLLDKYRDDERIMMISGDNFQFGNTRTEYSYYFSRFNHIWGWASWRRSWKFYDVAMTLWPAIRDGGWLNDIVGNRKAVSYWTTIFDDVYKGKVDTWDYQFVFASWVHNALTIIPNVNLVTNIGYGLHSTHTHESGDKYSDIPAVEMQFPLNHPPCMIRDSAADELEQNYWISINSLPARLYNKLMRLLP